MYAELLAREDLWKTVTAMLPVIAAVWKVILSVFQFFKTSKINKLKNTYKEFGEHLSKDEQLYLSKEIRRRVMKQLIGFNDSKSRQSLVFILGRMDLNLSKWRLDHMLRFLNFDGVRFYFDLTGNFKTRFLMMKVTSFGYLLYALYVLFAYFYDGDKLMLGLIGSIFVSFVCGLFSLYLWGAYPSKKKIMSVNRELLTLDCSDYLKDNTRH